MKYIFIKYNKLSKVYHCYNLQMQKVVSQNVEFDENYKSIIEKWIFKIK
uniref:Retroviral polymerase SH3-like domain-containing protein n=1 Tax=Physcomitrium patens TaxID=3218 RepID=A0A2K1JDF8_PHYPA|nr:hypothetical protein PHYPA_019838 [Physcomitrium patens]